MEQPDLFGEIPVSVREVELWVFKVPRIPHYGRRALYIRQWRVVEKIRAAKAAGDLDKAIPNEDCDFCGQRLAADLLAPATLPALDAELRLLRRRVQVLEFLLAVPAELRRGRPTSATVP